MIDPNDIIGYSAFAEKDKKKYVKDLTDKYLESGTPYDDGRDQGIEDNCKGHYKRYFSKPTKYGRLVFKQELINGKMHAEQVGFDDEYGLGYEEGYDTASKSNEWDGVKAANKLLAGKSVKLYNTDDKKYYIGRLGLPDNELKYFDYDSAEKLYKICDTHGIKVRSPLYLQSTDVAECKKAISASQDPENKMSNEFDLQAVDELSKVFLNPKSSDPVANVNDILECFKMDKMEVPNE